MDLLITLAGITSLLYLAAYVYQQVPPVLARIRRGSSAPSSARMKHEQRMLQRRQSWQ